MSRPPLPPINFKALADALLQRADELVRAWLPGGKRVVDEYVCGSLGGGKGGSVSVNLKTGKWAEFNGQVVGGDLVSLYAAIHDLGPGEAALQVARAEGLESVAGIVAGSPPGATPPPPPPRPPAPPPPAEPDKEEWTPQPMVPPHAPAPTFKHWHRRLEDIVHKAAYRVDGHLLGYVVRFRTSDGGKETLPYTWCVSERDGAGAWKWKTWAEPRPLFYPGGKAPGTRTVIVVEGEVKSETLQELLDAGAPGVYCVVSWPGGSKGWKKATWQWLKGCTVLLWPDCDSKREQLTKAEREACADDAALERAKAAKPLLPENKQPGMAAMRGIGFHLRDAWACTVSMLPIPEPGVVVDGWDCGDAIKTDGWDFGRLVEFFGQAGPLIEAAGPVQPQPQPAGGASAAAGGGSEADGDDDAAESSGKAKRKRSTELPWWLDMFVDPKTDAVRMSRKAVIACLRNDPALSECLAFNELSGEICTRKPWPWRTSTGPISDTDDLRLGDWISGEYHVPGVSRAALTEAIHTVADENPFHPVREYLDGLKHDGKARSEKWLMHVLRIDPATLDDKRRQYLMRISKWWLMGMVARIYEPGCKFDYSLVLEGLTGRRKSTLLEVMAGKQFYSDTHFDIGAGNKDGFDQLQGLWLYELSEMAALRKADSESVKAFFSSKSDRYRSSYGRYVQNHLRQCVIGCSTNKRQYLYDTTGNRRFWPVWVDEPIRVEWFVKWRDQLFAEAVALYRAGERYAPTLEEEQQYFVPEQELRLVETGVQAELLRLLTREGADDAKPDSTSLSEHTNFVTMGQLVRALGTDVGKSTSVLESQIRGWLEAQGWLRARGGTGARPWGWRRPPDWPPQPPNDDNAPTGPAGSGDAPDAPPAPAGSTEGDDDIPI